MWLLLFPGGTTRNEEKELCDNISWLTLGPSAFVEGLGCAPETQS